MDTKKEDSVVKTEDDILVCPDCGKSLISLFSFLWDDTQEQGIFAKFAPIINVILVVITLVVVIFRK